jgi:acetyl-CoA carboxylase carboxyltransferase component
LLDNNSFREVGPGSGGSDREPDSSLRGFSPANLILRFGKINGRNCIIGGEDFTINEGSPNEARLRKSVYTEDLALQNLIRLHQAGEHSVTGSDGNSNTVGGPKVVKRAIKESTSKEDLGGAQIHTRNGIVDNIAEDEPSALK